jgi:hypothetical protein
VNYEGTAHSIRITTNDPNGFYISQLYAGNISADNMPEPGTVILSSCGLALVAIARRRYRRKA